MTPGIKPQTVIARPVRGEDDFRLVRNLLIETYPRGPFQLSGFGPLFSPLPHKCPVGAEMHDPIPIRPSVHGHENVLIVVYGNVSQHDELALFFTILSELGQELTPPRVLKDSEVVGVGHPEIPLGIAVQTCRITIVVLLQP